MRPLHFLARAGLGTAVPALALIALLHLWLPVGASAASPFAHMNLLDTMEPRALVGTLLHALSAEPATRGRLLAALNMLSLFAWLLCVLKIIERRGAPRGAPGRAAAIRLFWLAMFAFSVNPYTAVLGLLVDMPAAALVAAAAVVCLRAGPRPPAGRIALATALALAAVLVHEKSVFDLLILLLWLSCRRGPGAAARLLAPALLLAAAFLLLASGKASWGLPAQSYAAYALSLHNPILAESFNVWGILFGGGAFWLVYPLLGRSWCRQAGTRREALRRAALLCGMALPCVAQLLVAHDTNRLVALIWLPVALLAGAMPIERALPPARLAWAGAALLLFQLAMPPSLVFKNGMLPYNCYASAIADRLPRESEVGQVGVLSLMAYDRNYLTTVMHNTCRRPAAP